MTEVIAKVHSVHLLNIEQCQVAADPQTKPPDLGCESAYRQLSSRTTIAILGPNKQCQSFEGRRLINYSLLQTKKTL